MTEARSRRHAEIVRAGAKAARGGAPRSKNPYPLASEDWTNWMDGFDQQTVWNEEGRGVYEPFPALPRSHS